MSTKAKTEHTQCTFTLKEHADGTPWVMVEPYAPGLPAVGSGFVGLTLRPGISFEQAKEITRELCENFEGISYTHFLS